MTHEAIILGFWVKINLAHYHCIISRRGGFCLKHIEETYISGHSFLQVNVDKSIYFILKQFGCVDKRETK